MTLQPKGIVKHRLKLAAALDQHETTRAAMAAGGRSLREAGMGDTPACQGA